MSDVELRAGFGKITPHACKGNNNDNSVSSYVCVTS